MADNLDLWNKLGTTDPAHTKGFTRGGGFKGTAIKPIYTEQKMTEIFGPCGVGWGFSPPQFQVVPGSDGQVAVYCWLALWINYEGKISGEIPGVGGDMVVIKQQSGLRTNDEAFKAAFTDAIGNAMKHIGMSADVHMGRFDDSKYVQELRAELAEGPSPPFPGDDTLPKAKSRDLYAEMRDELDACATLADLAGLWNSPAFKAEFVKLKQDWKDNLTEHKDELKAQLTTRMANAPRPSFDHLEAAK
jgi:hypothetical protein